MLKSWAKTLLRSFGYQLSRLPRDGFHRDAFADQKLLLAASNVRCIFDVGANVGITTSLYREMFPEAQILAFEPHAESMAELRRRYDGCDHVAVHQLAISDRTGPTPFYINNEHYTNSLLPLDTQLHVHFPRLDLHTERTGTVLATTLDDFCAKQGIDTINLLKMDIQGGERMALEGASQMIDKGSIDLVYTELLFARHYDRQAMAHDVMKFLVDRGYALFGLYNIVFDRIGVMGWCDGIFLSPTLADSCRNGREG